jgi:2-polyprenyl-3-methyl-5-hydroxy-6-metoxy-1,4-benzoquinol methylase
MSCARELRVPQVTAGHLDYYLRHGLNPVRYEMADLRRHLDRRASLHRHLGLPPRLFRDARVLEVAPGSGQNSLHVARLQPRELVLVEPNPTAQEDIRKLYAVQGLSPVQPRLVRSTFQEFADEQPFDVVICENWLGHSPGERELLRKLGRLVAADGVLTVTTISTVGIVPNVLRKALTCRLDRPNAPFAERTALLSAAFGPHLETIPAMTRTHTDWVHDNVMNPAYFGILLTIPMVLEELGAQFDVFGSSPHFAADWRWFKSLWGEHTNCNAHFLNEYHSALHNFLDYRAAATTREPARNQALESAAWDLIRAVAALELATYQHRDELGGSSQDVEDALAAVETNVCDLSPAVRSALAECRGLWQRDRVSAEAVARLDSFRGLFGRETLYLSLVKTR